ncbi:MAG: peptidoglycan DD-metalloendopeptidase family protein [Burkholderiales bacterium]|nr:peptidoglycan DD-metalloendopeptidase family protein [Burkholderiales bacterium]
MPAGRPTRGASWLVAAALVGSPAVPAPAAPADDLRELRGRIDALKRDIERTEGDRAEAADSLKASERAISEANRALRDLAEQKRAGELELQDLGRRSRALGESAATQGARLSRLIHDEYVKHQSGYVKMFFSGENPAAAAREIHYASYVSRAQARLIEGLRANLAELQRLAAAARDKTAQLAEIEARQRAEREQLARESAARKKVLTRLATQIRTQRQEVSTLERNEKRLTELIERLARLAVPKPAPAPARKGAARDDRPPESGFAGAFATLRGKLRLPAKGELAGRFGMPREGGGTTWKGVFIRAGAGEDVRSVAPGRVVFADWMRGFGNLIIVDHGDDYLSIYGNNETLFRQAGEAVAGGDAIARVGNSGGSAETGLYFELRHQGKPFDPLGWTRR